MNRKGAIGAIIAGLASAVAIARGQQTRVPTRSTSLSLSTEEELRKKVAELEARVQDLSVQTGTVGFSKDGDNWVFAPSGGSVTIKAPVNLVLTSANAATVHGSGVLTLTGTGSVQVKGGMIQLN